MMQKVCWYLLFNLSVFFAASQEKTEPISKYSLLFSGTEYVKQFNEARGNPFFPASKNFGNIIYYGNVYNNIELLYDCEDDIPIIRDVQGLLKLRLIREKLDEFTVDQHKFIKIKLLSSQGEFYEEIYRGKYALLMQWQKKAELDAQEIERYVLRKTIFMLKGNDILPIAGKSTLFSLIVNKEKELKKIYRSNRLNYKKNPLKAAEIMIREIEKQGW
jgi:uncharacterized protein YqgQ